ncbi:hypothetical protein ACFL2Q_07885 [Thermodesulfobacteriota bacterium]
MRIAFTLFLVVFISAGLSGSLLASDAQLPCPREHSQWVSAYEAFQASLGDFVAIKNQPLGPSIERELSKGGKTVSMAVAVRSVLDYRGKLLDRARQRARRSGYDEKRAFKHWNNCASKISRRWKHTLRQLPEVAARNKLVGKLPAILMREAFIQYNPRAARALSQAGRLDLLSKNHRD